MENSTDQKLEGFEQRELIASGSFSWIYRCLNRKDGSVWAIKIAKSLELFRRGFWQEDYRRKTLRASPGQRPAPLYRTKAFGWGSEWLETFPLNEALTPSELLRRQAAKLSACNDSSLVRFIEAGVAEDQGYLRTGFDARTIGPELSETISHTFPVVERAYLETLATVTRPSWLNREITPAIEDLLLKAIGLRRLADGRIDLGERFKGFRELKDALIEQMTII
jgi:hypothetical protein